MGAVMSFARKPLNEREQAERALSQIDTRALLGQSLSTDEIVRHQTMRKLKRFSLNDELQDLTFRAPESLSDVERARKSELAELINSPEAIDRLMAQEKEQLAAQEEADRLAAEEAEQREQAQWDAYYAEQAEEQSQVEADETERQAELAAQSEADARRRDIEMEARKLVERQEDERKHRDRIDHEFREHRSRMERELDAHRADLQRDRDRAYFELQREIDTERAAQHKRMNIAKARRDAIRWLTSDHPRHRVDREAVCSLANIEPEYVQHKAKMILARIQNQPSQNVLKRRKNYTRGLDKMGQRVKRASVEPIKRKAA